MWRKIKCNETEGQSKRDLSLKEFGKKYKRSCRGGATGGEIMSMMATGKQTGSAGFAASSSVCCLLEVR